MVLWCLLADAMNIVSIPVFCVNGGLQTAPLQSGCEMQQRQTLSNYTI